MKSKASMLKKLAARITTANGDISAVQGTSISEIIRFMTENLNVNADGMLVVSALKVSNVGGNNLLSAPITVESVVDEQTQMIDPLGIEAGKTYKVAGTYGADNAAFEFTSECGTDGSDSPLYIYNGDDLINGILVCTIMEGVYEGDKVCGVTLGAQNPDDADSITAIFSPFIVNSITEV